MYEELLTDIRYCVSGDKPCGECKHITELCCDTKLMEKAADAIEQLQAAVPRWIPVTERLPEEVGTYLVCGRWREKQPEIWVCEFMIFGCLKGWANNAANPSVSYWMPLPEPPKEGEG